MATDNICNMHESLIVLLKQVTTHVVPAIDIQHLEYLLKSSYVTMSSPAKLVFNEHGDTSGVICSTSRNTYDSKAVLDIVWH